MERLYVCHCWLPTIGEMGRVGIGVEDRAFNWGVDNPLPLAVNADERGADVMASISTRRLIIIVLILDSIICP